MASQIPYRALFPNTHVQGFEEIMNRLQQEIYKIKGASIEGLIKGAVMVRRDTEYTAPVTPVDYGNLRSSWFITTATHAVGKDQWNKGFKSTKKGSNRKVNAARLAADHDNAIAESKAALASKKGIGLDGVTFGYSAFYAVYVHENKFAKFKRVIKAEGDQPAKKSGYKWFQNAVFRNRDKFVEIVAQNVKIKK
jgi:hypothetical protein